MSTLGYAGTALARLERGVRRLGPEECWPWTGAQNGNGYGNIRVKDETGRWRKAFTHRMVLEVALGRRLTRIEYACHTCDVRICCNPLHLFVADHSGNAADMRAKGRSNRGERHGLAKLTDQQVRTIRALYASRRADQRTLAERYGVSVPCVSEIVRGRKWPHAGGPILERRHRVDHPIGGAL